MKIETEVNIPINQNIVTLIGKNQENLKLLKEHWDVELVLQSNNLIIIGEEKKIQSVSNLIKQLSSICNNGYNLNLRKLQYIINLYKDHPDIDIKNLFSEVLLLDIKGRAIGPRTLVQKHYIDSIKDNDIVFAFGPAGTGKTFLAIALAVVALRDKQVGKIVLTRPVVEAGENLGYLPGDIQAKVDPYFRPLYDALYEMLDFDKVQKLIEKNVIEIAPLAYMRGRTLHDSFIILDEAQNTTHEQLKMFLTRMGIGSKIIVTGDLTQIDLGKGKVSALKDIEKILSGIKRIKFIHFTDKDIVRHELVQSIVQAYEKYENNK